MRRAWALAILAAIVLAAGAAEAKRGRDGADKDDEGEGDGLLGDALEIVGDLTSTPADTSGEQSAPMDVGFVDLGESPPPEEETAPQRTSAALSPERSASGPLLALGAAGAALLGAAAWLARRSRRPKASRPARKTFEHGRRLGRQAGASGEAAARIALQSAPVGSLEHVDAREGQIDVILARRRSQPCAPAAGYLTGLFESAWGDEVHLEHARCAGPKGGECRYLLRRGRLSGSATPAGAASTPGSAGALRRSPPARAGGG